MVAGPRDVQEEFAMMCAQHLSDICGVAVLLPWGTGSQQIAPNGILAPRRVDDGLVLADAEIRTATENKLAVLVPAIFDQAEEEASARKILPLFTGVDSVCIFILQLLPRNQVPSREANEQILARHDNMLSTGVDDVFMNPAHDPEIVRRMITAARTSWEMNVRRMQLMLDFEPAPVNPEEMRALQSQHRKILWDSIPSATMPHFKLVDRNLVETGTKVDKYRLVRRLVSEEGTVLKGADEDGGPVVIKVRDKTKVCTPGELEGIYRELRFLSDIVKHPNVVKCVNMLHSPTRVYLVFEFAGDQNLAAVLSARPGQRLEEEETLRCFAQVAAGLQHCHSKDVTHRSVSLEHIILALHPGEADVYHCTLVDFHCAMVARHQTLSRTVCGKLPCIAPEMALGGPYVPRMADCWSAAVVLLEMGGGLTTLSRSVSYDPVAEPHDAAPMILAHFGTDASHARALAFSGGVKNLEMIAYLEALMQPDPARRAEIEHVLRKPRPGEDPASQQGYALADQS